MDHCWFTTTRPPLNQRGLFRTCQNIPPDPQKMHFHSLMSVNQHNNNILCIYLQTLIMNLVNNINLYHCSFPMTCVEFDHENKSQHSIDSCICLNINCSLLSCFNTMELIKYSKYTSKKLPSIVQHSHVRTWSLPQVPPSAYVAQCAASASLILIWWFD